MQVYPEKGQDALMLVMQTYFPGTTINDAWVASVEDPKDGSQWEGGRFPDSLYGLINNHWCSAYVNVTTIKSGERRTARGSIAGYIVMLDDVGTKLDKAMVDALAPQPTFVIETSPSNYQYQYGLDPPASLETFGRLRRLLKQSSWRDGVKDAGGDAVQYVKLPYGRNNKPGLQDFETRIAAPPGLKRTIQGLAKAFGLDLETSDEKAWTAQQAFGQRLDPSDVCPDLGLLKRIVEAIPNDSRFDDVLPYMGMLYAIKGAGGEAAKEIALEWAYQQPQDPPGDPDVRWDRLKEPRTGLGRLLDWVLDRGLAARFAFEALDLREGPPPPIEEKIADPLARISAARGKLDFNTRSVEERQVEHAGGLASMKHDVTATIMPGLDRGEMTVLAGWPGANKSLWAILISLAITADRADLAGEAKIDWLGDVIMATNEDDTSVISRRLDAAILHYKLDRKWKHGLIVTEERPFERKRAGKIDRITLKRGFLEMIATHRRDKGDISLIVIDTLAGSVDGASEETNPEFQQISNGLKDLAKACNCCVLLIHHFRKSATDGKKAKDVNPLDQLRGGSALGGAARNVMILSHPTEDEAKSHGLNEDDRRALTKLTMLKRQHGAFIQPRWLKRVVEPVDTIDQRDGTPGQEDAPVLVVEQAMTPMAEMMKAFRTLAAEAGPIRKLERKQKSITSIGAVLGMSETKANALAEKMVALGWAKWEKTRDSGNEQIYFGVLRKEASQSFDPENEEEEIEQHQEDDPF